jgi:hypothetical protein
LGIAYGNHVHFVRACHTLHRFCRFSGPDCGHAEAILRLKARETRKLEKCGYAHDVTNTTIVAQRCVQASPISTAWKAPASGGAAARPADYTRGALIVNLRRHEHPWA